MVNRDGNEAWVSPPNLSLRRVSPYRLRNKNRLSAVWGPLRVRSAPVWAESQRPRGRSVNSLYTSVAEAAVEAGRTWEPGSEAVEARAVIDG